MEQEKNTPVGPPNADLEGDDDDDEDEEDEEYDPTKDKDEEAELLADQAFETAKKEGSGEKESLFGEIQGVARKRRVDELWEGMKLEEAAEPLKVSFSSNRAKKRRKDTKQAKKLLAGIFGSNTVAREIVAKTRKSASKNKALSKLSKKKSRKKNTESSKSLSGIRIARMKTVTETAKFAGQTIEVKRQVLSDGAGTSEAPGVVAAPAQPSSSLDAALSAISGPTKLNTVTKSSSDWENFKEETGAAGELEQAAKDGYLAKKEFLERCDVRAFERERDTRLAKKK